MINYMANLEKEEEEEKEEKEEKGANNSSSESGSKLILLTYPKIVEEKEEDAFKKEDQRPPMTGSIDQIGSDLKKIKDIGVEHVIFGFSFGPIGRNVDKMIDTTKQLTKF
jgi:hypothetical protein